MSTAVAEHAFVPPAHLWIPDRAGSYGQDVIDFGHMAGLEFDDEQVFAIDAVASHDRFGNWTAGEVGIVAPRQNGKTLRIVLPLTLWDLFEGPVTSPVDEMVHTAHRFKTSGKTFAAMKKLIDGCYELRREVKRISESHGDEFIELINGAMLSFLARSDLGGRGLGGKRVDLDEAFAIQTGQLGALLPTMLARANSQVIYASSAGMARSGPLRELRDRGRAGDDPGLVWVEWCAPGSWKEPGCVRGIRCNHHRLTPGCALDRPENHRKANWALGSRITDSKIGQMRRGLSPLEFGREICGWWDDPDELETVPIPIDRWNMCADPASQITGNLALAFDVAPDRRTAAVAVAGRRGSAIHGEVVRYDNGTAWVVGEIQRLAARWKGQLLTYPPDKTKALRRPLIICDPAGPASALLPDFQKVGVVPRLMTPREMGDACGGLQDAVMIGPSAWVHLGQPPVDVAVEGAIRRDIGDGGWGFGRAKSAVAAGIDICPLVAVTEARWAVTVAPPPVVAPRFG